MSLLTLLRGASIVGAVIWTVYLVNGWSNFSEAKSYGMFKEIMDRAQNALMIQTGIVLVLYVFGFFGGLIFGPSAEEREKLANNSDRKSNDASSDINTKNTASHVSTSANSDTRECPFCAETIKAAAKMCRFCQSPLNPEEIK